MLVCNQAFLTHDGEHAFLFASNQGHLLWRSWCEDWMQHKDKITPQISCKENAFILIPQFTRYTPTISACKPSFRDYWLALILFQSDLWGIASLLILYLPINNNVSSPYKLKRATISPFLRINANQTIAITEQNQFLKTRLFSVWLLTPILLL